MRLRLLLLALFVIPFMSYGQLYRHHEMGIMGAASNYYGDLQEKLFPNYGYNSAGGLQYKFYANPKLGYRFGLTFTQLSAADSLSTYPNNVSRNLSFATNLFELHSGVEYCFLPVDKTYYRFSPYIFGGISVFYFNPYAHDANDQKVYLRPLSTEGQGLSPYTDRRPYSLVNVAVPMGGGFKFLISKKVVVNLEMGFRYIAGDYIDDVSSSYVNLDTLHAYKGKQAVEMSYRANTKKGWDGNYPNLGFQRGNGINHDWYWFGGIGVNIYFDTWGNLFSYRQTKCPTTKKRNSWN